MKSYIYNKVVIRLIMGLLPFYLFTFLPDEACARKHKQLVILHTNDTHSTILPVNPNIDNKELAGRGGFLRRINVVKEQRELHPGLLLIDSGDFSQGSGYYTLFKGEVEVGLMNQMGYDAATIGNHEFDYGMDNMAKLFRQANFPMKIGLFALAPPLKGLVFDSNCEGITYLDPAETAQKYIDILRRQEKCDLVICISHLGWEVSEYPDEKFLSLTEGCDLVLGGHTHTYMPTLEYAPDKNGKMIPVDQNGKHGAFIGKLVLDLEKR